MSSCPSSAKIVEALTTTEYSCLVSYAASTSRTLTPTPPHLTECITKPEILPQICKTLAEKIAMTPISNKLGEFLAVLYIVICFARQHHNIPDSANTQAAQRLYEKIDDDMCYYVTYQANLLKMNVVTRPETQEKFTNKFSQTMRRDSLALVNLCTRMVLVEILGPMTTEGILPHTTTTNHRTPRHQKTVTSTRRTLRQRGPISSAQRKPRTQRRCDGGRPSFPEPCDGTLIGIDACI